MTNFQIPPSAWELRKALEDNPHARTRLHEALKEFPSPDERSAVMNQLMDPPPPRDPTKGRDKERRDPLETIALQLLVIIAQFTALMILLASEL